MPRTKPKSPSSPTNRNPESALLAEQLRNAFEGDAWHGPAVLELLADIDPETAAAHPLPETHSIWEIALHIAAWDDAVNRRIRDPREWSPELASRDDMAPLGSL